MITFLNFGNTWEFVVLNWRARRDYGGPVFIQVEAPDISPPIYRTVLKL